MLMVSAYGQLTQLVECLRHMEEVRGSSPLLPTKRVKHTARCAFLLGKSCVACLQAERLLSDKRKMHPLGCICECDRARTVSLLPTIKTHEKDAALLASRAAFTEIKQ